METARDRAKGELDRARARLAPLALERAETREAAARFSAALAEVYRDPVVARRRIQELARAEGVVAAAREVAAHPDRFGQLHGTELGPMRSAERRAAAQHARDLAHASGDYLRITAVARGHRHEYRDAKAAVAQAESRLQTLDAELSRGAGVAQLRLQIGEKLRALQPQRRHEVAVRLSPAQRMLLGTAMTVGLAFAREQGHER
jgi:hypothetical protein